MRKSKIISLSLTDVALKYAEEYSKADGKSRSAIISEAVTRYCVMRKLNELGEYGKKQAAKKGIKTDGDVDRIIHEYRAEKRKSMATKSNRS